ncbi:MAG: amidase family protein, partial [Malacoplasma sp.]
MSDILNLQKEIKDRKISISNFVENTKKTIKSQDIYNSVINYVENHNHINNPNSILNGIPYAVKDNINVFNSITTGGSRFFENFNSPYNATIIDLLNSAGAIPIVKANLDEFGLGGDGLYSGYGDVINPFDSKRISGGSSSGPAVLVAKKLVPFALGTDTGDSIRKPASFMGIIGYKPTYGLISRNGVFPYSPSIDHVGLLANNLTDVAIVLDVIVKHDINDFSSQKLESFNFYKNLNEVDKVKKSKIVIFKNIVNYSSKEAQAIFSKKIKKLETYFDIDFLDFDISLLSLAPVIYKIISYSEAVSCYQNLTGIPFGEKSSEKDYEQKVNDIR